MKNEMFKGLMPYPRNIEKREGTFEISKACKVYVSNNVKKCYGFWLSKLGLTKIEENRFEDEMFVIYIGGELKAKAVASSFDHCESYTVDICEDGITLAAKDEKGLTYAVKTLVKIVKLEGNTIEGAFIDDAPMIDMRAIHMCLFNPKDGTAKDDTYPEDLKRRLEIVALSGYNHVFIEFWGVFPYEKHPYACWPHTPYTKENIEEIVNLCINDLHIIPCPGQNMTSHAGWSRITTRQHVSLDQRPDLADMWIPGGWCFATENPKTKQFHKDIIDELLEAFHNPPMMHCGCDKAFGFGSTEEDRTKSADLLFAMHISNLNTYITSKGVRPVMWADMLYTSMDSLTFRCKNEIADLLPKNILMNIWTHNDPGEYWGDVDFFQDRGYQTVYSPFMNYDSIENMIKICIKEKSLGLVQTTWFAPEQAIPYYVYSAAKQWNNSAEYSKEGYKAVL